MTRESDRLWYRRPAGAWEEALPIGNRRLGAMLFGGVRLDRRSTRIRSGRGIPARRSITKPGDIWPARELVFAEKLAEAQRLIEAHDRPERAAVSFRSGNSRSVGWTGRRKRRTLCAR
jgi:alpha-L-fucosidase 2